MSETIYRRHIICVEPGEFGGYVAIASSVYSPEDSLIVVEVTEPTEAKALAAARERVDLLVEKPR